MLPEDHIVVEVDHIHDIVRVILLEKRKNFEFYACLVLIFLFIFDYFNCYCFLCFVIKAFESLSKRSSSNEFENFISITYMVFENNFIVSFLIIISKVMLILW